MFWAGLVLCTIYQSYRYPLQVSSAGTSPTYTDTPFVLQAGKFVLAVPLIVLAAVRWLSNSARIPRWPIVFGTLFLSIFSLLKILNGQDSQYLDVSFWMIFSLVLVLSIDSISIAAIDKYFSFVLVYALGSTIVQVFLFLAFGRLPALAFEGSYLVRFGGFLDDPNGFAAICFLLLGWSFKKFAGWPRRLVVAGLFAALLLTQSWTALAFFAAASTFAFLIIAWRRPVAAALTISALPLLAILIFNWIPKLREGFLFEMLEAKQESIEGHMFPWAVWASKWTDWVVLGEWKYNPYESWWASSMINFGLAWLCVYFALLTALLIYVLRAFTRARPEYRAVYSGVLLFSIYFVFGSLNLPFPIIFPINALFFLFCFLVAFGKISAPDRAEAPSADPPRMPTLFEAATE